MEYLNGGEIMPVKYICIDFDGTYSAFSEIMSKLIDLFQADGHKVICTTMRYEHEVNPLFTELVKKGVTIYFTGRKAKAPYLQAIGIIPSLWIDDKPEWLFTDSL